MDLYKLLQYIPKGYVTTYKALAKATGKPEAARVVGTWMKKNKNPVKYPCYKVVKSDGKIGGYGGGIKKKIMLLKKDGITVKNGKIVDFDKCLFDNFKNKKIKNTG